MMHQAHKDDRPIIKQMMANEKHLYVELNHKKNLLDTLWQLSSDSIKKVVSMRYLREFDEQANERMVKPVGIIFSEYYFYLIAYPVKTDFDFLRFIGWIELSNSSKHPFLLQYRTKNAFKKVNSANACSLCIRVSC